MVVVGAAVVAVVVVVVAVLVASVVWSVAVASCFRCFCRCLSDRSFAKYQP